MRDDEESINSIVGEEGSSDSEPAPLTVVASISPRSSTRRQGSDSIEEIKEY